MNRVGGWHGITVLAMMAFQVGLLAYSLSVVAGWVGPYKPVIVHWHCVLFIFNFVFLLVNADGILWLLTRGGNR